MFEVVCINGNYHVNSVDVNSRFISTDKNALIKEIAARIGVSILTSDEVKIVEHADDSGVKSVGCTFKKPIEKTDWDTEPISHDGIQFNKHFIELKMKVQSLESTMSELLKRLGAVEESKKRVIDAIDAFVADSINEIDPYDGYRVHRNITHFARYISEELKK